MFLQRNAHATGQEDGLGPRVTSDETLLLCQADAELQRERRGCIKGGKILAAADKAAVDRHSHERSCRGAEQPRQHDPAAVIAPIAEDAGEERRTDPREGDQKCARHLRVELQQVESELRLEAGGSISEEVLQAAVSEEQDGVALPRGITAKIVDHAR